MKTKTKWLWALIVVAVVAGGLLSFGHAGREQKTVTVGVVSQTKQDEAVWQQVAKTAKDQYGLTVKVKNFTDYNQPNKALKNGDVDLNAFQHQAFLDAWNKANHGGVVAIGKTYISPIRLYSRKYHRLSELPNGATIAIPNDASNESRALFVLKNAGLITLKKGTGKLATISAIATNPHQLKIKEVNAEQTPRALSTVAAAVVNNNYARPAGLGAKQTIYVEPVNRDSAQWINVIAAKKGTSTKKAYREVVKSFQTEQVKQLIKKEYGDTQLPAWDLKLN